MFGGMGFNMGGGGGRGMMMGANRRFETQYQCFSAAMANRSAGIDEGDKILLPPSALDALARMNVEYPMLFELTNDAVGKKTHCGVLEFSAEEGRCYMPFWMMQNMLMEEGQLVSVKNVSLAKATFVKFRAQNVDFLEISNHRAVLEVTLRKFTCLSEGDVICITHSGKNYFLDIREVKPNGAASIIETDCDVDFEEPLGFKESKYGQYERDAAERNSIKEKVPEVVRTLQKAREITAAEIGKIIYVFIDVYIYVYLCICYYT
jgi:ubiquitin fusion degradation protein 1